MGMCSSRQQANPFPDIFKDYAPQVIEIHAFAMYQLQYLQKRKKYIMEEAKESVSDLIASVFNPVQECEQIVKIFYNEELRLLSQLVQDENIVNHLKFIFQDELIQVNSQFTEIKNDLSKNLQGLEIQIYEYINQKFRKIQKETQDKTVRIKYSDKIKKEQVEQILQRVRSMYKAKLKSHQTEIKNKFRQLFNQENYLKVYSKVKFNFDQIYKRFESILSIVQNGKKNQINESNKGKLKLILTQSDQTHLTTFIEVKQSLANIKQQNIIKQLIGDIKQASTLAKQRLFQISTKVIKLQQNWREQKRSLIKAKKKQAQSNLKK